jgi:hypothetical protein
MYDRIIMIANIIIIVLNFAVKHHTMKEYGEWRYSSTILDLGTRWR